MTGKLSTTRSRCGCGHNIILVNGHWQHVGPHPEHACSCTEPKPGNIGQFRTEKPRPETSGISVIGSSMRRLSEDERVTEPWQLMEAGL